jgi:hypothetical protein
MQTKSKPGEAMYGFIECTVGQFMTRSVMTVKTADYNARTCRVV